MAGNLTRKQFDILEILEKEKRALTQRELEEKTGFSLGTVNKLVKKMTEAGWINDKKITDNGIKVLTPYKVDNAIIMAAGMSSRFAPLSYEIPKGLLKVKGEILIERQIRQLQQIGITDITIVVGYMKEKFFYLQEKFGVKVVVNEDYYRYNNPSTLLKVLDKINNTYICSSDDYFTENVFEQYVYDAYYAAVFFSGQTEEWGLITDNSGVIKKVEHNVNDMWCMSGHAYFSKDFSEKFKKILLEQYEQGETKTELWEKLYERNTDELKMYIRKYPAGIIYEFDSLQELREFDNKYLENTGSNIFKNICKVLHCKESEIQNIDVIKQGLTNLSFKFSVGKSSYVYRHPGIGTDDYISRKSEAFSMQIAHDLKLDNTFICMGNTGWKLSHYVDDAHTLDYHNETEVKNALTLVKRLHDAKLKSKFDFDIWKKTKEFIAKIPKHRKNFNDFEGLYKNMCELYEHTKQDNIEKILCHCDCYDPNFLIDEKGNMSLIDWEYSGNDDPANDLGTFICCCADYTYDDAVRILEIYHGRKPTAEELRHEIAYTAIASYYWYVWAVYLDAIGNSVGEYLYIWYKNAKIYMAKAFELYGNR